MKYFYYFIISFLAALFAQTLMPNLGFFANMNVLLVFVIFLLIVWGFNLSFIFAAFIGLFLNIYSYLPFGSFILIYLLILLGANFLYKNVFINFSLFTSLILIVLSSVSYGFLLIFLNFIFYKLNLTMIYISLDKFFFYDLFWQIILNSLLMAFVFILGQFTTRKLNLAFLIKR
ncbi:MAG: hypothetical protein PHC97_03650 [Patescibacteria group bacterium]|nr:hypothetical protein [Patescibacteria group bacterium]